MKKIIVQILKKTEILSALSIRIAYVTGKSNHPIHPKHLVLNKALWFQKYLRKSDRLLDLGCGPAQDALKCAKLVKSVYALDVENRLITIGKETARERNIRNVRFFVADANQKLPFKDSFFDKLVTSDVLEHLHRRNFALKEIKRVLKSGGLLFLVTDNPDTGWKKKQRAHGLFYYADRDHKYEYPEAEILDKLRSEGFEVISTETVTYDTPLKGFIDIVGGFSLILYIKLGKWRQEMVKKHPEDTTGYKIVAKKV